MRSGGDLSVTCFKINRPLKGTSRYPKTTSDADAIGNDLRILLNIPRSCTHERAYIFGMKKKKKQESTFTNPNSTLSPHLWELNELLSGL